jgi:adenylate kinase
MELILLGAPGCGKGTQAKKIVAWKGLAHISTGDMLRAAVEKGDDLGQRVRNILASGELVTDEIVIALVKERIREKDCEVGFVLDGFPRTVAQAESLEKTLDELGRRLTCVLDFEIADDLVIERITNRRTCASCGAILNLKINPPKDNKCSCGGTDFIQREDDNEETVRSRLKEYFEKTAPLVDYYEKKGMLVRIRADLTPDDVFEEVREALIG